MANKVDLSFVGGVIRGPCAFLPLVRIGYGNEAFADYLKLIPMNHDRGGFVDADSEQVRMFLNERYEVKLPISYKNMLVNGTLFEECESLSVVTFHLFGSRGISSP